MENKTYLRLAGGFGNQIFQLTTALKYSSLNNIYINLNYLGSYKTKRKFELIKFLDIKFNLNIPIYINLIHKLRLAKFIRLKNFINDRNYYLNNISSNIYILDGYFLFNQNYDHFIRNFSKIKPFFKDLGNINLNNRLVIHIRGTDFKSENVKVFEKYRSYYYESLNHFHSYRLKPLIVTDDIPFASNFFSSLYKSDFEVQSGDIKTDFNKLVNANYLIGSPSTFCWISSQFSTKLIESTYPDKFDGINKRLLINPNEKIISI